MARDKDTNAEIGWLIFALIVAVGAGYYLVKKNQAAKKEQDGTTSEPEPQPIPTPKPDVQILPVDETQPAPKLPTPTDELMVRDPVPVPSTGDSGTGSSGGGGGGWDRQVKEWYNDTDMYQQNFL